MLINGPNPMSKLPYQALNLVVLISVHVQATQQLRDFGRRRRPRKVRLARVHSLGQPLEFVTVRELRKRDHLLARWVGGRGLVVVVVIIVVDRRVGQHVRGRRVVRRPDVQPAARALGGTALGVLVDAGPAERMAAERDYRLRPDDDVQADRA